MLNGAEQQAQFINRRDRQYVVLEGNEYRRLIGDLPTLKELLLQGPSLEGVELGRDKSGGREMDL